MPTSAHHLHYPKKRATQWTEKPSSIVPIDVQFALWVAMKLEAVPLTQFDDLLWIMAQESAGVVNARNPRSTERGLYQLLRIQYPLNPKGEKSFGDAIEECQGGIRYVMGRYHTAARARAFWTAHHWY